MSKRPEPKPHKRWLPKWVDTTPLESLAGLDLPDTRTRCADCANLRSVGGLYGFKDNGRCTGTGAIYHPVPEQPRHCPFNAFIPRT